jgi:hypothetical protein
MQPTTCGLQLVFTGPEGCSGRTEIARSAALQECQSELDFDRQIQQFADSPHADRSVIKIPHFQYAAAVVIFSLASVFIL